MTKEFTELQAKYVAGIESMSESEACRFLDLLKADNDAPFREERTPKLERYLADIERSRRAHERAEAEWTALALEYKALTEKWEELGATWRCWHLYTIWEYKGVEFYRWRTRVDVIDEIIRSREADKRLMAMIDSGKEEIV